MDKKARLQELLEETKTAFDTDCIFSMLNCLDSLEELIGEPKTSAVFEMFYSQIEDDSLIVKFFKENTGGGK